MREEIQKHLNEIKIVFLTRDYDKPPMRWIVEAHIYAIEEILNKEEKE